MMETWRAKYAGLLGVASGGGIQRVAAGALLVVMVSITSRWEGLEAAGVIGVSTTLAIVAALLADFGTTPMALREFAVGAPTRNDFRLLVKGKLVAAFGCAAVFAAGSLIVQEGEAVRASLVALLSVPIAAVTATYTALLVSRGRGARLGLAAAGGLVAGLAALVALRQTNGPVWTIAAAVPIARFVELAIVGAGARFAHGSDRPHAFGTKAILRSWPMAAQGALQVAYQRSTLLVAAPMLGAVATGYVAQGLALYGAVAIIPSVLALAAFPRMVRKDEEHSVASFSRLALVLVGPLALVLLFAPGIPLRLLFGHTAPSLDAFTRWSALSLLLAIPNSLIAYRFLSLWRERLLALVSVVTTAFSIGFVAIGARTGGVRGVGWSLPASEGVTSLCFAIAYFWFVRGVRSPVDAVVEA